MLPGTYTLASWCLTAALLLFVEQDLLIFLSAVSFFILCQGFVDTFLLGLNVALFLFAADLFLL